MLVYTRAAKRLDDLPLPKEGRKDTTSVFIWGEAFEGIMNDEGSAERREGGRGPAAYGFVNMMSDAPSVQRIMCRRIYIRAGSIPHVRGSPSLEGSYRQAHISIIHVGRWALTVCNTAATYKESGARREMVTDLRSRR